MSPGPIQLDQATALTLMLGPNGSVGIQASGTAAVFAARVSGDASAGLVPGVGRAGFVTNGRGCLLKTNSRMDNSFFTKLKY